MVLVLNTREFDRVISFPEPLHHDGEVIDRKGVKVGFGIIEHRVGNLRHAREVADKRFHIAVRLGALRGHGINLAGFLFALVAVFLAFALRIGLTPLCDGRRKRGDGTGGDGAEDISSGCRRVRGWRAKHAVSLSHGK